MPAADSTAMSTRGCVEPQPRELTAASITR
jgi:hypothetical protein